MTCTSLSAGCIQNIMTGIDCDAPILQIVYIRKGDDGEIDSIDVSDGRFYVRYVQVSELMKRYIQEQNIEKYSIIHISRYGVRVAFLQTKILTIYEFEISERSTQLIGHPQIFSSERSSTNAEQIVAVSNQANQTSTAQLPIVHTSNKPASASQPSQSAQSPQRSRVFWNSNIRSSGSSLRNQLPFSSADPVSAESIQSNKRKKVHRRRVVDSDSDFEEPIGNVKSKKTVQRNQQSPQTSPLQVPVNRRKRRIVSSSSDENELPEYVPKISIGQLSTAISSTLKNINKKSKGNNEIIGQENEFVANFGDIRMTRLDLETLKPGKMINDTIVSFYCQYLQDELFASNTNMLFVLPTVVQMLKDLDLDKKEYIFLPVNDSQREADTGLHWTLMLFSRPDNKCFSLDSSHNMLLLDKVYRTYEIIKDHLHMELCGFEAVKCLRQKQLNDCAIHVLCNAEKIATLIAATSTCCPIPLLDATEIDWKRDEITAKILSLATPAIVPTGTSNVARSPQPSTSRAARNNAKREATQTENMPNQDQQTETVNCLPPPRKRAGKYTRKADKIKRSYRYIKCALRSIFRSDCSHTDRIISKINELVAKSTKICFVASLVVLDVINRRYNESIARRDWFFFNGNSSHINTFFNKCFQAPTVSTHRTTVVPDNEYMTQEFVAILNEFGITSENVKSLNNISKTMFQTYHTNFKNNIVVHAKQRLQALLKLKFVKIVGIPPNKENRQIIKDTVNFMFNPRAKCERTDEVDHLLAYFPNNAGIDIDYADTHVPGFLNKYMKRKWFAFIPLFMKIQREINEYQVECRLNSVRIQVRNFHVVPLHSHCRKHIKIDQTTFKYILSSLKLDPKVFNPTTRRHTALSINDFINHRDPTDTFNPYWFEYFDWQKIQKMGRKGKEFNYTIVTDGLSVSIEYVRVGQEEDSDEYKTFEELVEEQNEKYKLFAERYMNDEYDLLIGMDPGYKLFIAAVLKFREVEMSVKISSKEYYYMTKQNIRDAVAKKLTGSFEDEAKLDREDINIYNQYPSPQSPHYMEYIRHRLKFFERGMAVYTTNKYARLSLDQYILRQQAMDSIVNKLTESNRNGRILLCIGSTRFNSNSPIKKYRRCPGTRKIIQFIKKLRQCDVMYIDEYNTSQACGKCQKRFDKDRHERWNKKGIRHRVCDDCHPRSDIMSLPTKLASPKSQRNLQDEKLMLRHEIYRNNPNVTWDEAVFFVNTQYKFLSDQQRRNVYAKPAFNNQIHRSPQTLVWNRDISASRNILIKGVAKLRNLPLPPTLQRGNANVTNINTNITNN